MDKISDNMLIGELKKRLSESKKALSDLRSLTNKLETVNMKLRESEALKSNFLSNVRNEIVNPLTSIIGLSDQVASGIVTPDSAPEVSRMIYNEAFDLDYQLRNIFMAAELEAGEASLNPAKVDTHTLLSRLVEQFNHKIQEKGISVDLICSIEGCGEVCREGCDIFIADSEKLHIVFMNLLANAIEFSPEGDRIAIRVVRDESGLIISIEDNGIGIKSDVQKDIFDRFKQLSTGSRKKHKGHGLGLSVVKSLLDLMGGRIKLSSVAGKGTTFTITIPEAASLEGSNIFSEEGNEFIFNAEDDVSEGEVQEF